METVTIKDIAKICGVGVSTVSRAINNHPDINPETKAKILEVIKENHYMPNNSAQNLKRTKSNSIAVLIKGILNPLFSKMIAIIQKEVQKKGYTVILRGIEDEENEIDIAINLVNEKRLKGIIFLGGFFTPQREKLELLKVPFVISTAGMIERMDGMSYSCVSVDDFQESYKLVDYLCSIGHKKIAMIASDEDDKGIGNLRYLGYKKALEDNGIEFDKSLIKHMRQGSNNYSPQMGYQLAKELLQEEREFTALYAIADMLAIGACRAFREMEKKIPEEYSVVGFDGIELGEYMNPSLTTVHQPVEEIAIKTVQLLFELMKDKQAYRQICMEGNLIIRESMKRI